jgi:hypothetical protein
VDLFFIRKEPVPLFPAAPSKDCRIFVQTMGSTSLRAARTHVDRSLIVNILVLHITMNPRGIVSGAIATVCQLIVFSTVRPSFAAIFRHHSQ